MAEVGNICSGCPSVLFDKGIQEQQEKNSDLDQEQAQQQLSPAPSSSVTLSDEAVALSLRPVEEAGSAAKSTQDYESYVNLAAAQKNIPTS